MRGRWSRRGFACWGRGFSGGSVGWSRMWLVEAVKGWVGGDGVLAWEEIGDVYIV